jgi:hypothetical protein
MYVETMVGMPAEIWTGATIECAQALARAATDRPCSQFPDNGWAPARAASEDAALKAGARCQCRKCRRAWRRFRYAASFRPSPLDG